MLKIAWKFIRFDRAKSIGVVVGIVISTFLIGQQVGIFLFLTDLMSALATTVKADIWVVDGKTRDVNQLGRLDMRTLRTIQGLPGVAQAFPLMVSGGSCNYENGTSGSVTLIGVDIHQLDAVLDYSKIIKGKPTDLQTEGAISAEFYEKKNLGDKIELGTPLEVNGKRAFFALQTRGFRGFGNSFCVTTIERARYFANQPPTSVSAVLVRVAKGHSLKEVSDRINQTLYGVHAWPSGELASSTVRKILSSSGIALSTGTLIIFALVAGFFIIGLTMYSSALDRITDYGTLKAIGAGNAYISRLILMQALLFAVTGFIIAFALLEGFRKGVVSAGLIFGFSPWMVGAMFLIIAMISLGGASFALRRIATVEPASVFR